MIQRPLGRRDNAPFGDSVSIFVDSMHDGRNAYVFSLSAAGVLSDGLQSEDDDYSADWDAVWEGAVATDESGWTAEFAIPFTVLRFQDHGAPVFGLAVRRTVGRTHEEDWSVEMPRSVRGEVSRFGALVGLSGLASSADLGPSRTPRSAHLEPAVRQPNRSLSTPLQSQRRPGPRRQGRDPAEASLSRGP